MQPLYTATAAGRQITSLCNGPWRDLASRRRPAAHLLVHHSRRCSPGVHAGGRLGGGGGPSQAASWAVSWAAAGGAAGWAGPWCQARPGARSSSSWRLRAAAAPLEPGGGGPVPPGRAPGLGRRGLDLFLCTPVRTSPSSPAPSLGFLAWGMHTRPLPAGRGGGGGNVSSRSCAVAHARRRCRRHAPLACLKWSCMDAAGQKVQAGGGR
jgi:hypothetical protein